MYYWKFATTICFTLFVITTKAQLGLEKKYDCFHFNSLTAKQRIEEYPFNNAKKIKLISLLSGNLNLPIKGNVIDWLQVKDSMTVNQSQIDTLSDILFNIGCRTDTVSSNVSYAVGADMVMLFYNSKNELFEYIPICFECMNFFIETENKRKNIGRPCNTKFEIIRRFVKTTGLRL